MLSLHTYVFLSSDLLRVIANGRLAKRTATISKKMALGTHPRGKKDPSQGWLASPALQLHLRSLREIPQISLTKMLSREVLPIAAVAFVGLLAPLALAVFATQGPVVMQVVAEVRAVVGLNLTCSGCFGVREATAEAPTASSWRPTSRPPSYSRSP